MPGNEKNFAGLKNIINFALRKQVNKQRHSIQRWKEHSNLPTEKERTSMASVQEWLPLMAVEY